MATPPDAALEPASAWRSVFPPLRWLRTYDPSWLPRDAVSGVTLAA